MIPYSKKRTEFSCGLDFEKYEKFFFKSKNRICALNMSAHKFRKRLAAQQLHIETLENIFLSCGKDRAEEDRKDSVHETNADLQDQEQEIKVKQRFCEQIALSKTCTFGKLAPEMEEIDSCEIDQGSFKKVVLKLSSIAGLHFLQYAFNVQTRWHEKRSSEVQSFMDDFERKIHNLASSIVHKRFIGTQQKTLVYLNIIKKDAGEFKRVKQWLLSNLRSLHAANNLLKEKIEKIENKLLRRIFAQRVYETMMLKTATASRKGYKTDLTKSSTKT